MSVKAILENLEGVADNLKSEYQQGEDGKYYLDLEGVDGHPSVGALKRAKEHEKNQRLALASKHTELMASLEAVKEEKETLLKGAIPKEAVEKLEASYKEKFTSKETALKSELDILRSNLTNILVDNEVERLAITLSNGSPELLKPHIRPRLKADLVEGKAVTRVLDKEGNLSAFTLEDLEKEFRANPIFSPIIKGNKASGGGANEGFHPGNLSGNAMGTKQLSEMTPAELVAHIQNKKQSSAR